MNKTVIIGIVLFIIGLVIVSVKIMLPHSSLKELELTYKINAGIPFKWIYEIEDPNIVQFVKSYVLKDENTGAITGAPVYRNYVFKGKKEGKTTIIFKMVNIDDETDIMKEEKNNIIVDKDNNISIVENNSK